MRKDQPSYNKRSNPEPSVIFTRSSLAKGPDMVVKKHFFFSSLCVLLMYLNLLPYFWVSLFLAEIVLPSNTSILNLMDVRYIPFFFSGPPHLLLYKPPHNYIHLIPQAFFYFLVCNVSFSYTKMSVCKNG